jgi:hypothetical protein
MIHHILKDSVTLTPAQLEQVKRKVREYANQDRWGWLRHFVPGFLPILAIPFWLRLRRSNPLPLYIAFEIAFTATILWWIFWNMKRTARRFAFRAVRDLGYADICPNCGYAFKGLPESQAECPECGTIREPMIPPPMENSK